MSAYCQARRGNGSLCPHPTRALRSLQGAPAAVCLQHLSSAVQHYGRVFEIQQLPEHLLEEAAEIYEEGQQRALGESQLAAERACRAAASARECRVLWATWLDEGA